MQGATPYVRMGNWPVVVFSGASLLLCWLTTRRRSQGGDTGSA
jgi:apolipoprotein N-acyltransferase